MHKTLEKILGFCKRWKKTLIVGGAALAVLAGSAGYVCYDWQRIYHAGSRYSWQKYQKKRDRADIERVNLEIAVNQETLDIEARSDMELNAGGKDIVLILNNGFTIDEAVLNGREASAERDFINKRIFTVKNESDDRCNLSLRYHGKASSLQNGFVQIDSAGWLPEDSNSFPSYRISVTVRKGLTAIAPGNLVGAVEKGDNKAFTYETERMRYPVIIAGNFRQETRKINDFTYNLYYTELDKKKIDELFRDADKIVRFYTELFGDLGNRTFTFVQAPGSCIHANFSMMVFSSDKCNYPFLAHELSHSWWGCSVSYDEYESRFYESLAMLSELTAKEKLQLKRQWQTRRKYFKQAFDANLPCVKDVDSFSPYAHDVFYYKAPHLLLMLQEEMGEDAFFKGLKDYFKQERYKISSIKRFQEVMQENSEKDLSRFFEKYF